MSELQKVADILDLRCSEAWTTHWAFNCGFSPEHVPVVWEPAAGQGHLSRVLTERGFNVLSTDVYDYGYPDMAGEQDFFDVEHVDTNINLICTFPPHRVDKSQYGRACTAEDFVRHALKLMEPNKGAVLMLLRHDFDTHLRRLDLFEEHPFAAKMVMTQRPATIDPTTGKRFITTADRPAPPRIPMAWFYWDWRYPVDQLPQMHWLPKER